MKVACLLALFACLLACLLCLFACLFVCLFACLLGIYQLRPGVFHAPLPFPPWPYLVYYIIEHFRTLLSLCATLWTSCLGVRFAWGVRGPTMQVGNLPGYRPPQKSAYVRALRRAARYGGTWYRNTWLTTPDLADPPEAPVWQPRPSKPRRSQHRRLKFYSWNTWTLTSELWIDVQSYLREGNLMLLCSNRPASGFKTLSKAIRGLPSRRTC